MSNYIHLFSTTAARDAVYQWGGSNYQEPWVSLVEANGEVNYNLIYDRFNKYPYVDLGLPSGNLYYDYGNGSSKLSSKYAWGDGTEQRYGYTRGVYKYWDSQNNIYTKYNDSDQLIKLTGDDDYVAKTLGGDWIMPTRSDITELIEYTDISIPSNYTITFTSKINGNSVSACRYGYQSASTNYYSTYLYAWTSELDTSDKSKAYVFKVSVNTNNVATYAELTSLERYNAASFIGVIHPQI